MLSMRYSTALIPRVFLLILVIYLPNLSFKSKVAPKYLTKLLQLIFRLFIFISSKFDLDLSPKRIATVLQMFIIILHSINSIDVLVRRYFSEICPVYIHIWDPVFRSLISPGPHFLIYLSVLSQSGHKGHFWKAGDLLRLLKPHLSPTSPRFCLMRRPCYSTF